MVRKLFLIAAGFLLFTAAPAAAQYGPTVSASASTVAPGGTVTISGEGFPPNTEGTVTLDGQVLASFVTDGSGAFSVQVTIPAGLAPGSYTLVATAGGTSSSTTIQVAAGGGTTGVVGGGTTTAAGGLPRTGADDGLSTMALIGAGLLVVGGLAFVGARRRSAA